MHFFEILMKFLEILFVFFSYIGAGCIIYALLKINLKDFSDKLVFKFSAGLYCNALTIYACTVFFGYRRIYSYVLYTVGIAAFIYFFVKSVRGFNKNLLKSADFLSVFFLLIIVCGLTVITAGSFAPIIAGDSLRAHLVIPKYINDLSHFPEGQFICNYYLPFIYMIYLQIMAINADIIPLFSCITGIFFLYVLYGFFRRIFSRAYAMAGIILFLYMPITYFLFSSGYLDLFVAFFGFAAINTWLKYKNDTNDRIIVTGFYAALSFLSKFDAFFSVGSLFIMIVLHTVQNKWIGKRRIVKFAVFFILFSLCFLARNYMEMNNPVWPFANSLFGGIPQITGLDDFSRKDITLGNKIYTAVSFLYDVSIDKKRVVTLISPFFLISGIFALKQWRRYAEIFYFIGIYWIITAAIIVIFSGQARFEPWNNRHHYVLAVFLVIWALAGLKQCIENSSAFFKTVVPGAVMLMVLANSVILLGTFRKEAGVFWGTVSEKQYLEDTKSYYRIYDYLHSQYPEKTVLLIGTDERYYLETVCYFVHWTVVYSSNDKFCEKADQFFSAQSFDRYLESGMFSYIVFKENSQEQLNDGIPYPQLYKFVKKKLENNFACVMKSGPYCLYKIH